MSGRCSLHNRVVYPLLCPLVAPALQKGSLSKRPPCSRPRTRNTVREARRWRPIGYSRDRFLALMLGVQRPSVTIAAGLLQRAGLLRYSNGLITVLDRAGLEAASCECYRVVQRRFAILLGHPTG